jgi:hypothetical protein
MVQEYSAQIFNLKQEIQAVFGATEHPGTAQNIRDIPCCPDHDANALWLSQHTWVEFQNELEQNGGDPFEYSTLPPKAYLYFIPAVLLFTLDHLGLESLAGTPWQFIWDWPYVLIPILGTEDHTRQAIAQYKSQYLPLFTRDQRSIIEHYLTLVCTLDRQEEHISAIEVQRALDEIWSN